MKCLLLLLGLCFVTLHASGAESGTSTIANTRHTVQKSLKFLAEDMDKWRTQRKCAACHHGPMFVWSGSVAHQQGYQVDLAKVNETADWMVNDAKARMFENAPGASDDRVSLPTLFLAHALNSLPSDSAVVSQGWRRITGHWKATQRPSGEWIGAPGRPPIFNTPEIQTYLATLALAEAPKNLRHPSAEGSQWLLPDDAEPLALTWLERTPKNETHQRLVLQLWSAAAKNRLDSDSASERTSNIIQQLRDAQREDGGWRQAEDLGSDAFATGQTLVAFHRSGIPLDDAAVSRAIEFLVRTQNADSTWPMTSRPNPVNGRRATNLNPITYAATAWATLGLSLYVAEEKR